MNILQNKAYKKINTNIGNLECNIEEAVCDCNKDEIAPCSAESKCLNVFSQIECDPDQCPAKAKCRNQIFHRGEQFTFDVKITTIKGFGLFSKDEIPTDSFNIEYKGEVITDKVFRKRFNEVKNDDDFYFLKMDKLYIDAKECENDARFINHSCDPNSKAVKWTVCTKGKAFDRVGIFATWRIQQVNK